MKTWGTGGARLQRGAVEWLVGATAIAIVLFLLATFAEDDWMTGIVCTSILALAAWTFLAREAWWLLLPMALGFGGTFFFGFKIYTHEIALLVCLLPLVPLIAARKATRVPRAPLPLSLYVLLIYMVVHLGVSLYLITLEGREGQGSIFRVYVRGLWPLVFAVPFYLYGKTRYLKWVLILIYVSSLCRSGLGLIGYYAPAVAGTAPGFLLPGIYTEGMDLRESGLWLLYASLAFACLSPSRIARGFHLAVAGLAGWFVVVGGSRVSLGISVVIPLIWAAAQRRFILLGTLAALAVTTLIAFNANPDLVHVFPERIQRTLSIVVMRTPYQDVHRIVEGSDDWHYGLMHIAYNNWTRSVPSFVFGTRLIPYREPALETSFWFDEMMRAAASLGYYEAGLWTVLAVFGVFGLALYVKVFAYLIAPIARALWREGISDVQHAFYFLAVSSTFIWVIFAWIAGHFPSEPLLLVVIARAAFEDRQRETKPADSEPSAKAADAR